jgi:hypothetical protein
VAIALVQQSSGQTGAGGTWACVFPAATQVGNLVVIWAYVLAPTTPIAPAEGGWVNAIPIDIAVDNGMGGVFAKICDGGADFRKGALSKDVGDFTATGQVRGAEFSGVGSATPDLTDSIVRYVQGGGTFDATLSKSPLGQALGIIGLQIRESEGGSSHAGASGTTTLNNELEGGWGYRIGGPGALPLHISDVNAGAHWLDYGAAWWGAAGGGGAGVFGEPGGGVR